MKITIILIMILSTLMVGCGCMNDYNKDKETIEIDVVALHATDNDFSDDNIIYYDIEEESKSLPVITVKGLGYLLGRIGDYTSMNSTTYRLTISQLPELRSLRKVKNDGADEYYCVYQDIENDVRAYLFLSEMDREVWRCGYYVCMTEIDGEYEVVEGEEFLSNISEIDLPDNFNK